MQSLQNLVDDDDDEDSFVSPLAGDDELDGDMAELEKLRQSVQNNLRLRPLGSASSTKSPSKDGFAVESGPRPISAASLAGRLGSADRRPLLLDTRPLHIHLRSYLYFSVNLAIPSLILKRCRKPGGSFTALDALKQFITTDEGRAIWDDLFGPDDGSSPDNGLWDGDIVIYDHSMDPKDETNPLSTPWVLLGALAPLVAASNGSIRYLDGGFSDALNDPDIDRFIIGMRSGDTAPPENGAKPGMFQLDTNQPFLPRGGPVEIYTSSTNSAARPSALRSSNSKSSLHSSLLSSRSNLSLRSSALHTGGSALAPSAPLNSVSSLNSIHSLPSGAKSSLLPLNLKMPADPEPVTGPPRDTSIGAMSSRVPLKRPSAPNLGASAKPKLGLGKLNTKSTERLNLNLPKLQVKPIPMKSPNVQLTFSPTTPSDSPTKPWDDKNTKVAPSGAKLEEGMTPYYTPPHSPSTPKVPLTGIYSAYPHDPFPPQDDRKDRADGLPPSPSTARPESMAFNVPPPPPGSFPPGKTFGFGSAATPPSPESPPSWSVSTILPNFLFLGPEPNSREHVDELRGLGVKRMINIAAECEPDDHGLNLDGRRKNDDVPFEKYTKIPMRDTVEEDGMRRGIAEVCDLLGGLFLPLSLLSLMNW
jgi:hypothetical protein